MTWQEFYPAICAEFGYDPAADEAAASHLQRLLAGRSAKWRELGMELRNRSVHVLGSGPSLEATPARLLVGARVVACDGATSWARAQGVVPDVVVTDLDGNWEDLQWAATSGAQMVVHAHGDNDAVLDRVAELGPRLHGTHQGLSPMDGLQNVGGFTDGDRAVALLEFVGAREAILHGFDFDDPPHSYSGKPASPTKAAKLAWAKRIVSEIHERGRMRIVNYRP